jgi:hypothetical protein
MAKNRVKNRQAENERYGVVTDEYFSKIRLAWMPKEAYMM